METLRSLLKVVLIVVFVLLLVSSVALVMYGRKMMNSQSTKIVAKDREIEKLGQSQQELEKTVTQAEAIQKQLQDENIQLKRSQDEIEVQKGVILKQVRSSVDSFENFRVQANQEIERLKKTVVTLETERVDLEGQLKQVDQQSAQQQEDLKKQISDVNERLKAQKATEQALYISTQKKSHSAMVRETAKMHFNAGNFYYQNRDYPNAVNEYKKALFYTPDDAQAHYNLAVVSDQVLGDWATALEHYKRYVQLSPDAKDVVRIKEKIMDLEINLQIQPLPPTKVEKVVKPPFVVQNAGKKDGDKFVAFPAEIDKS
ncbi:MAG: tetratricopeptide repeat protein [Candidatus Omnitrophota bacterium]